MAALFTKEVVFELTFEKLENCTVIIAAVPVGLLEPIVFMVGYTWTAIALFQIFAFNLA